MQKINVSDSIKVAVSSVLVTDKGSGAEEQGGAATPSPSPIKESLGGRDPQRFCAKDITTST